VSDANVENLRAFIERWDLQAWVRGEIDMSLYDPDVTYEDTILPDHAGEIYRGYEGYARAARLWLKPAEEPSVEPVEILGAGDHLVSIQRFCGRARFTGLEFEVTYACHWTFRDGKVVHINAYLEPAEALKAAGLAR